MITCRFNFEIIRHIYGRCIREILLCREKFLLYIKSALEKDSVYAMII